MLSEDLRELEKLLEIQDQIAKICLKIDSKYSSSNKIIFSGIGKNEILAELINDFCLPFNLNSVFLDPVRAIHGSLGLIKDGDIILLSSKSGNTEELINFMNAVKQAKRSVFVVLLTSNEHGQLLNHVNEIILIPKIEENSLHNHSPQLTIGAYYLVFLQIINHLIKKENISLKEYLINHQGGEIGKNLYT